MYDDLLFIKAAPEKRSSYSHDGMEHHLTEAAVMLAFGMHLFRTVDGLLHIDIHPDGEHAKLFDIANWLGRQGFAKTSTKGKTTYGGLYKAQDGRLILVNPTSGRLDVVADVGGVSIGAECKGGVVNTTHPGLVSRARRGLCEAVGLLFQHPRSEGQRQFAVVPKTTATEKLATLMLPRVSLAGIEIALVDRTGKVTEVRIPDDIHV